MTAGVGRKDGANPADFYPTPPRAAYALVEFFLGHFPAPRRVIDPCAGMGCLLIPWTVPRAGEDAAELLGLEGEAALVASSRRGWVEADRPASPVRQGDGLAWLASSEDRAGHGRAELVIANPPFSRADEWVKAVVAWVKATGSPAAVLRLLGRRRRLGARGRDVLGSFQRARGAPGLGPLVGAGRRRLAWRLNAPSSERRTWRSSSRSPGGGE
mgnify:CR=1 FL=1